MRRFSVVLLAFAGMAAGANAVLADDGSSTPPPARVDETISTPATPIYASKRVRVRKKVRIYGAAHARRATYYSTEGCDPTGGGSETSSGLTMFKDSIVDITKRTPITFGVLAVLPGDSLYMKRVELSKPIFGRRDFFVADHIGSGSTLDVWLHCWQGRQWNNPILHFRTYTERWQWVWETRQVRLSASGTA